MNATQHVRSVVAARLGNQSSAWRPMRIAVVGGRGVPSNYSGVETIVENLFGAFAEAGHKVTVYCRPGVLDEPFADYRGMRLVRTPMIGGKLETPSHTLASCLHAVRHGATNDGNAPFDCISFHAIPANIAQIVPAIAGIPTIAHVHGLDHQRAKWRGLGERVILAAEREMVRRAAHIATVNYDIISYYRDNYGIHATPLPNGVKLTPDELPVCEETLKRFGLQPGKFFVMVSRLVPEKRHGDVIEAFSRVRTDHKLVIVGEGNQSNIYVQSIHEQAARDPRVVFTGLQGGAALETLFRQATAYVTASDLEGMPSSLLECMERGVCPIVSAIPPHFEVLGRVPHFDYSFTVGDVGAIVQQFYRVLSDPGRVGRFGAQCRTMIRREYGWPTLARRTIELYERVLRRPDIRAG